MSFPVLFTGDDPPRDRTSELRVLGFPSRHLGPVQMTTDTALGVTKLVTQDKIPLNRIPFIVRIPPPGRCIVHQAWFHSAGRFPSLTIAFPKQDFPTIRFNAKESVEMPFRYIAESDEPKLPPGMRQLLYDDLDKSLDC